MKYKQNNNKKKVDGFINVTIGSMGHLCNKCDEFQKEPYHFNATVYNKKGETYFSEPL